MADPKIEEVLAPLRASVKEQVSLKKSLISFTFEFCILTGRFNS